MMRYQVSFLFYNALSGIILKYYITALSAWMMIDSENAHLQSKFPSAGPGDLLRTCKVHQGTLIHLMYYIIILKPWIMIINAKTFHTKAGTNIIMNSLNVNISFRIFIMFGPA